MRPLLYLFVTLNRYFVLPFSLRILSTLALTTKSLMQNSVFKEFMSQDFWHFLNFVRGLGLGLSLIHSLFKGICIGGRWRFFDCRSKNWIFINSLTIPVFLPLHGKYILNARKEKSNYKQQAVSVKCVTKSYFPLHNNHYCFYLQTTICTTPSWFKLTVSKHNSSLFRFCYTLFL